MSIENMAGVIEAIKERDNFLITAHVNPEGDSIGSQLTMLRMLDEMSKKAVIVNQDDVPDNLTFLSGADLVSKELPVWFKPEAAIVVDCPVLERAGSVAKYIENIEYIINIDHHVSNEFFGSVNWVDPKISSTGEMLYNAIVEMSIEIEKDLAEIIYTAIVTDTGMFNYSNTSGRTHKVVAELLKNGADPSYIHSRIYENKTVPEIRLLGNVLTTLQIEENGKISHISLTNNMNEVSDGENISTAEFINYPRAIKGVEVAVFFKESIKTKGYINVSFRSSGNIDVNIVASRLGGGGHKKASGCFIKGTLQEVREKVLTEIRKAMAP